MPLLCVSSDDEDDEMIDAPEEPDEDRDDSKFHYIGPDGEHSSPTPPSEEQRPMFSGKVMLPMTVNTDEYEVFPDEFRVRMVLNERNRKGELFYVTKFEDGHVAEIPFETLIGMENGIEAFSLYTSTEAPNLRSTAGTQKPKSPEKKKKPDQQDSFLIFEPESDGGSDFNIAREQSPETEPKKPASNQSTSKRKARKSRSVEVVLSSEDDELAPPKRRRQSERSGRRKSSSVEAISARSRGGRRALIVKSSSSSESEVPTPAPARALRSSGNVKLVALSYKVKQPDEETDISDHSSDLVYSDLLPRPQKRNLRSSSRKVKTKRPVLKDSSDDEDEDNRRGRRSGRTSHTKDIYKEPDMDIGQLLERDAVDTKPVKTKFVKSKEHFPIYDDDDEFVKFHCKTCDTCQKTGDCQEKGPLVFCQGCSFSYHRVCLGHRAAREHLVTRISEDDYVLQCRRCIGKVRMKDRTAPCLDRCTKCRAQGVSCIPFQPVKKQKNAADDEADTPLVDVSPDLINNPENILFRCNLCRRAWHYDHLPPRIPGTERSKNLDRKLSEYSSDWSCLDCINVPGKIQLIVAWRPADQSAFDPDLNLDDFNDDEREYLIKFENLSYAKASWMPGPWVWGLVNGPMRQTFCRKRAPPKLTLEDAIDEEFLRVEIVLDVKYTSYVPLGKDAEVDLARVKEVSLAQVKFRGLTYEDVVWDEPPPPDSGERWKDFCKAYDDYIHGFYVHLPKGVQKRIEKARSMDFEKQLEKKNQPKYIMGGTLMDYQMEGMNWLYYKWWKSENAILADEMGLGKTIQIISFLSLLHQEHKVWPFLIVVPHSTVPNWKREIQLWDPSLRVVTYFGAARAREVARTYELFHPKTKDLKCHVVVTSYTTPVDDAAILKSIPWEALIVDEGQRLKNDASLLYRALSTFKIKHKVLLTGTPLQNNPRELFNLLQFLDPKDMDAKQLEEQYGELTKDNVPELHALIRPYFLRRTKAQVLTMLPPMAEIIVPVTMTKLQKKLYKSILAKDTNLIQTILRGGGHVNRNERTKLGNILMQLRKCLCHPFIYSDDIEEKVNDPALSHKNLTEASAKLELLSIMLPKLKERGHRVLLFSQFLGMLDVIEDFLEGLGLKYARLDGTVSSLEKQKRIDAYNAPNSPLFAFLLSTRAGGVGINLATADTVIILDPDFNPHQDLQALSRAHRIGQKKKVLVFHLMTRDTAEEKIIQLGKKKLSLDHLIIEKMGADEDGEIDVESILKFGAGRLFDDEVEDRSIKYDSTSVDAFLDRSQIEQTTAASAEDNSAETAFSFARVWANDKGNLVDDGFGDDYHEIDDSTWDKILKEREEEVRREQEAKAWKEELGRGRRAKAKLAKYTEELELDSDSDTDFQAPPDDGDSTEEEEYEHRRFEADMDVLNDVIGLNGLSQKGSAKQRSEIMESSSPYPPGSSTVVMGTGSTKQTAASSVKATPRTEATKKPEAFNPARRPSLPIIDNTAAATSSPHFLPLQPSTRPSTLKAPSGPVSPTIITAAQLPPSIPSQVQPQPQNQHKCHACPPTSPPHPPGQCPYRLAGLEHCPLCGIAHYGKGPVCPHIGSETQIMSMMEALRESPEDQSLVQEAVRYLRGRLGELRRRKKAKERERERELAAAVQMGGGSGSGGVSGGLGGQVVVED